MVTGSKKKLRYVDLASLNKKFRGINSYDHYYKMVEDNPTQRAQKELQKIAAADRKALENINRHRMFYGPKLTIEINKGQPIKYLTTMCKVQRDKVKKQTDRSSQIKFERQKMKARVLPGEGNNNKYFNTRKGYRQFKNDILPLSNFGLLPANLGSLPVSLP